MKVSEKISGFLRCAAVSAALIFVSAFVSCESMIYDEEGDCDYYVHFKYDYNMKWADAFPHEVRSVTLYLVDTEGNIVWSKTESGDALAAEGYAMRVDVEPGQYDLIAWCGVENPTSFRIPDTGIKTGLTATLNREHGTDGTAYVNKEVDRLYYGHLDKCEFGHDNYHFTVPLIKDTNNIRVVLQHLSGEPVQKDMFTYTITDNNGSLDWDNTVLEDETLNYQAWHISSGSAEIVYPEQQNGSRAQTTYSTAVAEFTVSRLMKTHAPDARLIIRRTDNGKTIVNINLIDALLLVKGYYNREMSDQEYLDRQDEYSLTFFLDEGFRWSNTYIYINSWRVVLQNAEL